MLGHGNGGYLSFEESKDHKMRAKKDMWFVVLCFVLPAIMFSLVALVAWLRVLLLKYRRRMAAAAMERDAKKKASQIDGLITKKDGKVFCNIPIQVEDIETGAMFLYNSDENLVTAVDDETDQETPLVIEDMA